MTYESVPPSHREELIPIFLIGDKDEKDLRRYLDYCDVYLFRDPGVIGCAAVLRRERSACELKNISVVPYYQHQGYGTRIMEILFDLYRRAFKVMYADTGDSPFTIPFYKKLGFFEESRIPNYFVQHYPRPIVEGGVTLCELVMLKKKLRER